MARARAISGGILALLTASAVFGQARPAYEAVNIKVNTSGDGGSSSHGSGSQIIMTNMTLQRLIERAYNVRPFQVAGPDWMQNVHFDIAAKYPPDTKYEDRFAMLRTLLEDRLKLAAHSETRDLPGYALQVAKGGFKLKPVEPGGSHIERHGGAVQVLTAKQTSMAALAGDLGRMLDTIVVDRTGMTGAYDFQLHITIDNATHAGGDVDAGAPLIFALQDALGVIGARLQAQKVPVEVIVVDHAERVLSDNN
jgi:uncharacterized protein (TIGR03435 family)